MVFPTSKKLDVPFSLNQLVSRAVALASCFFSWSADCRAVAAVLRGSWRLLLSPPSHAKIREGTANQAINTDLFKPSSQQSCIKRGLFRLLHCYSFLLVLPVDFLSLDFYYLLFAFPNSSLLRLQLKLGRLPSGNLTVNYHIPLCCVRGWFCLVGLVFFRLGLQRT